MLVRTELLADEFYLLAHHDTTGRPLLPERVAGLGVAAGLLGELLLGGHVSVHDGTVLCAESVQPSDPLAIATLAAIRREVQLHTVREWLAFFGRRAVGDVARRLSGAGVLAWRASRLPLRSGCLAPIDPHSAAVIGAVLCTQLLRGESLDACTALLAGLVRATGLERDHVALWELRDRPQAHRRVDAVLAALPAPARELIGHTEAAIAAAITTHRV